jgi:hypothetical protein
MSDELIDLLLLAAFAALHAVQIGALVALVLTYL